MPEQLSKCRYCGVGDVGDDNCAACNWAYSEHGWVTHPPIRMRLTVDTSCINAKQQDAKLNQIEKWQSQGCLEIQKATPFAIETLANKFPAAEAKERLIPKHPPLLELGRDVLGGASVLAGPDLTAEIKSILFPSTKELTINQMRDIQHLAEHVRTGGHLFVTLNTKDFVVSGKEAKLRRLGVWAITPAVALALLGEMYGWQESSDI